MDKKIKKITVGADNGNGNFKGVFKLRDIVYYEQPNVQASFTDEIDTSEWPLDSVFKLANNLIISEKDSFDLFDFGVNVDDYSTKYFIGSYALERNLDVDQLDITDPNGKLHSELTTRGLSAYIAAELVKDACLDIKEETGEFTEADLDKLKELEVNVRLATAIPVRSYSKKVAIELANKFKEKPYELDIYLPKGKKSHVKINYTEVDVTAEAKSTIYFLQTCVPEVFKSFNDKVKKRIEENKSEEGEFYLNNEFFKDKNKKVLHLDIGEGTSEMPRTFGTEWDDANSRGLDKGIGHASDIAIKTLSQMEGTEHLRHQKQISLALKNKDNQFMDVIAKAIAPSLRMQGKAICTEAIKEVKRQPTDLVMVYGGGSITLQGIIEKPLEEACRLRRTKVFYIPKEFAVSLNALGLFGYASSDEFKDVSER